MIRPITEVLNSVAKSNGHNDWQSATTELDYSDLHELYIEAIEEFSIRGFHAGWEERSRLVSFNKQTLSKKKTDALMSINKKLQIK